MSRLATTGMRTMYTSSMMLLCVFCLLGSCKKEDKDNSENKGSAIQPTFMSVYSGPYVCSCQHYYRNIQPKDSAQVDTVILQNEFEASLTVSEGEPNFDEMTIEIECDTPLYASSRLIIDTITYTGRGLNASRWGTFQGITFRQDSIYYEYLNKSDFNPWGYGVYETNSFACKKKK
jgi:hypothetical protein